MAAAGAQKPFVVLTDDALQKLASIASIKNISKFEEDVRVLIKDAWRVAPLFDPEATGSPRLERIPIAVVALEKSMARLVTAARDVQSSMEVVVKAAKVDAREIIEAWDNRNNYERHLADIGMPVKKASDLSRRPSITDLLQNDHVLECISFLAKESLQSPPTLPKRLSRSRGRPESMLSCTRRMVVLGLISSARDAGGKLTFNKNHETNGTRALRVLAPFYHRA